MELEPLVLNHFLTRRRLTRELSVVQIEAAWAQMAWNSGIRKMDISDDERDSGKDKAIADLHGQRGGLYRPVGDACHGRAIAGRRVLRLQENHPPIDACRNLVRLCDLLEFDGMGGPDRPETLEVVSYVQPEQ